MSFKSHIFCCTNRRPDGAARGSCAAKGSEELRDYFKKRVKELRIPDTRVNVAGCLDRCEDGPVVVIYPEGVWYKIETREDVDTIISEHLQNGKVVQRLALRPNVAQ